MSRSEEFNQLVKSFYDRNFEKYRINVNNDEKYMSGFRLRLGKFISQQQ
ncbi:TPA: hypothetical protein ACGO0K_001319 [Streptococcus suis]